MSGRLKFFSTLLLALVVGCSGIQVSQDYTSKQNLAGLKTYAWHYDQPAKTGDLLIDSPLLNQRLREAIDSTLAIRGYQQVRRDRADFHIDYQYTIIPGTRANSVQTSIGFGFGSYNKRGAVGVGTSNDYSPYNEGLLVIDILDARDGTTLWRGKGTREVFVHNEPAKMTEQINETVFKILNQFPP